METTRCKECADHWAFAPVRPVHCSTVVANDCRDGLLLFNPETQNTHLVAGTGQAIWNACDGESSIEYIAQCVTSQFAVSSDQVLRDVEETLALLAECGLVE